MWPSRSARELERQIRALVEKMQERRRNPRGTSTEQMAAAEQDVDEVRPKFHYSHSQSILNSWVIDLNLFFFFPRCTTDEEVTGPASREEEISLKRS